MVAMFNVRKLLSMCYNSDFRLSKNEPSCDKSEVVYAYQGPRVIAPVEVTTLSRAVTSEPIAGGSSSASVDRVFVSADVSTDAEEDQGQFQGE